MPDGTMGWSSSSSSLSGFPRVGSIEFWYDFPSGTLPDGTRYSGTARTAYLPMSPEGITVFKMMVECFKRRLSFMVGTSITTGETNTVVWAGVHHKTSRHGGSFGYPDSTYLSRVTEELKARNIDAEAVAGMQIGLKGGEIKMETGKAKK